MLQSFLRRLSIYAAPSIHFDGPVFSRSPTFFKVDKLLVISGILLAEFVQSLSGFGAALITVVFLLGNVGIRIATLLVALAALTIVLLNRLLFQVRVCTPDQRPPWSS